jgi:hypothetical protein
MGETDRAKHRREHLSKTRCGGGFNCYPVIFLPVSSLRTISGVYIHLAASRDLPMSDAAGKEARLSRRAPALAAH